MAFPLTAVCFAIFWASCDYCTLARPQQLASFAIDIESDDNLEMAFQLRSGLALRALILCGVASAAIAFGQTDRPKSLDGEDAYIRAEAATHFFRGTVLVGVNGKIVFEEAYGLGDEEWSANNTVHTKFRIASLTKQFTAAFILHSAGTRTLERARSDVTIPVRSACGVAGDYHPSTAYPYFGNPGLH